MFFDVRCIREDGRCIREGVRCIREGGRCDCDGRSTELSELLITCSVLHDTFYIFPAKHLTLPK